VGIDSAEGHFEYSENPTNPFSLDKKGWYSYVKDQVGTIYKTYNHFTQQTSTTAYDSFGNTISQSGTTKSNLGFQSKYHDPESGLYYYYHRYYNPHNGRFLNEDPIGLNGGLNLSQFVGNDPINYLDPLGFYQNNPMMPWTRWFQFKKLLVPTQQKFNYLFGEDICKKEKDCRDKCFKALKGYYENQNVEFSQMATKFGVKQLVRFCSKVLKPWHFFIGEMSSFRMGCLFLCKSKKNQEIFSYL